MILKHQIEDEAIYTEHNLTAANFQKTNLMPQLHFKKFQAGKTWREKEVNWAYLMRNSSCEMHWYFNIALPPPSLLHTFHMHATLSKFTEVISLCLYHILANPVLHWFWILLWNPLYITHEVQRWSKQLCQPGYPQLVQGIHWRTHTQKYYTVEYHR